MVSTMRAAVLYQPGTIPTFTEFKEPVADDGHEVLEVVLAGLNPVDLYIAAGMYGELSVPCVVRNRRPRGLAAADVAGKPPARRDGPGARRDRRGRADRRKARCLVRRSRLTGTPGW